MKTSFCFHSCMNIVNFSVCKFFVNELKGRLDETAKSKAVIETGYSFDEKKRKKKAYKTS